MIRISLDESLKPRTDVVHVSKDTQFVERLRPRDTVFVTHNLDRTAVFHKNYLEYLEFAWGRHFGVEITPDIVWYTLLSELSLIVAEDPEQYRHLFSTSQEKQEISMYSDTDHGLPMNELADHLRKLVPDGFADEFLPEFTTSSWDSDFAFKAAFADAVSPFYSYSVYCCGIPYIEFAGTSEDWAKLLRNWQVIAAKFNAHEDYFARVTDILKRLASDEVAADEAFWRAMFTPERCGSGSQLELKGWFTDLFRKQGSLPLSRNFSTHVAKVSYKNLSSGNRYQLLSGLFHSVVWEEDCFLEPYFGHIIYREADAAVAAVSSVAETYVLGDDTFRLPKPEDIHVYEFLSATAA